MNHHAAAFRASLLLTAGPALALTGQPLRFEPNVGQLGALPRPVHFIARAGATTMLLDPSGATLTVGREEVDVVRVAFVGAEASAEIDGMNLLPGVTNHLRGGDPSAWRTGVPGYGRVRYRELLPGVDVVFYGSPGGVEYDIVVKAPVDPAALERLQLVVEGASRLCLDDAGDLRIETLHGSLSQHAPLLYQERDGVREPVVGGYRLLPGGGVGFRVGAFDPALDLVIDPLLAASTYLGGGQDDGADAVVRGPGGEVFVAGHALSPDFPTAGAWQPGCTSCGQQYAQDMFVSKLSGDLGTLLVSTFLGGSESESAHGLALDGAGHLYLAGTTFSPDFPVVAELDGTLDGYADAVLVKLGASDLVPIFSTYLGGSSREAAMDVAATAGGDAVLVGWTQSADFPTLLPLQGSYAGAQDGFVTRVAADGSSLVYSTFLGLEHKDGIEAVVLDALDRVYVTGGSDTAYGYETSAFLTKLNSSATNVSYHVELDPGEGYDVVLDAAGNAYVAAGAFCQQCAEDPLVAKVDANGVLVFQVRPFEWGAAYAVGVDAAGNVYAAGETGDDMPPICSVSGADYESGFVAKLDPSGQRLGYASYVGGSEAEVVRAMDVDAAGGALVAGSTDSVDFPVTPGAFQGAFAGGNGRDAFVALLENSSGPPEADFDVPYYPRRVGEPPLSVGFRSLSGCDVETVSWDFGDGSSSTEWNPQHSYEAVGAYTVSQTATNAYGTDTETKVDYIAVIEVDVAAVPDSGLAPLTVQFTSQLAGPVTALSWSFDDGTTSSAPDPVHTFEAGDSYHVCLTVKTPAGDDVECVSVFVTEVEIAWSAEPRAGQAPLSVQFTDATLGFPQSWLWTFGDGTTSTERNPLHVYQLPGFYDVRLEVAGPSQSESSYRSNYIQAMAGKPGNIVGAPGPAPGAPPRVNAWDVMGGAHSRTDILAYGTLQYGANVSAGSIDGAGIDEIVTGPGPGAVFGPQVRAFDAASAAITKVNFFAYGTLRYGVNVESGSVDADGAAEILTGAGPGAVFGPHVRGFDYDGVALAPLPGASFFAYGTLKHGANLASGSLEGGAASELLTAPGPGPTFTPTLRAFRYAPPVTAISKVNVTVFPDVFYGGRVGTSDVDDDGFHEILAGAGPGPAYGPAVAGFDYDGVAVRRLFDFQRWTYLYGARPGGGEVDGDGAGEILVAPGPDPAAPCVLVAHEYVGGVAVPISWFQLTPFTTGYGMSADGADLGF